MTDPRKKPGAFHTSRQPESGGPHAARCICEYPAPRKEGPLLVCGICSREVRAPCPT